MAVHLKNQITFVYVEWLSGMYDNWQIFTRSSCDLFAQPTHLCVLNTNRKCDFDDNDNNQNKEDKNVVLLSTSIAFLSWNARTVWLQCKHLLINNFPGNNSH